MAVDMIIDQWNPSKRRYRTEAFCYGPRSCPFYRSGPARKVPGRRGMTYTDRDWIDEEASSHCGADDVSNGLHDARRSRQVHPRNVEQPALTRECVLHFHKDDRRLCEFDVERLRLRVEFRHVRAVEESIPRDEHLTNATLPEAPDAHSYKVELQFSGNSASAAESTLSKSDCTGGEQTFLPLAHSL